MIKLKDLLTEFDLIERLILYSKSSFLYFLFTPTFSSGTSSFTDKPIFSPLLCFSPKL